MNKKNTPAVSSCSIHEEQYLILPIDITSGSTSSSSNDFMAGAFTLDFLRFRLLKHMASKAMPNYKLVGQRGKMFIHSKLNSSSALVAIHNTQQLLEYFTSAEREWTNPKEMVKTSVTITFALGGVGGGDMSVADGTYMDNLETDTTKIGEGQANYQRLIAAYSKDDESDDPFYRDPTEEAKTSKASESSRNADASTNRLCLQLYSNSHEANPFFHGMNFIFFTNLKRYYATDLKGKASFSGLPSNWNFESGKIVLPNDFFPNYESIIWTTQFSSGSSATKLRPQRGKYPPEGDSLYPPKSTDSESTTNVSMVDYLTLKDAQAKRDEKVTHVFFSRETIHNIQVSVGVTLTLWQQLVALKTAANNNDAVVRILLKKPKEGNQIVFKIPMKSSSSNYSSSTSASMVSMSIYLEEAKTMTMSELLAIKDIEKPVKISVVEELLFEEIYDDDLLN